MFYFYWLQQEMIARGTKNKPNCFGEDMPVLPRDVEIDCGDPIDDTDDIPDVPRDDDDDYAGSEEARKIGLDYFAMLSARDQEQLVLKYKEIEELKSQLDYLQTTERLQRRYTIALKELKEKDGIIQQLKEQVVHQSKQQLRDFFVFLRYFQNMIVTARRLRSGVPGA